MNRERGILIAGNWKMNHSPRETEAFFTAIPKNLPKSLNNGKLKACLIPPATSLHSALKHAASAPFPLDIAAQNAHWEKKGAFTGELSGPMLKEIGINTVLIGHSERRQYFGETDETVRKRAESLLDQGFCAIVCIGETRAEREDGQTQAVLERQMAGACPDKSKGIARFMDGKVVFAYEPVWAIGTGLTATPAQAEEAHAFLRQWISTRVSEDAGKKTPILYGGSVTPENIDALLACPNVDGGLVGGASLKPESFLALLSSAAKALA